MKSPGFYFIALMLGVQTVIIVAYVIIKGGHA